MPISWHTLSKILHVALSEYYTNKGNNYGHIDKEIELPILEKELDHIQSIIGRYDNFFFLMKQICLGAILASIGAYFTKPFDGSGYLIVVPIAFFMFEYSFRCAFWSNFIFRVLDIEKYFSKNYRGNIDLYKINAHYPLAKRMVASFKIFDAVFYFSIIIFLCIFSIFAAINPWKIPIQSP